MATLVVENVILGATSFVAVSLIGWGIATLKKLLIQHNAMHELLINSNQKQIKAQLLFMYRHAKDNGDIITIHELEVFNDLYRAYTDLGGNGFMVAIRGKVNKLTIDHDDDYTNKRRGQ